MQTKNYSDQKLHATLLQNVGRERVLLTEILHLLKEVERRRLFSDYKCTSTFDYAVRVLGYSEPQAGRRIQAMRLLAVVPEVEERLEKGELTLTSAAQVQQFVNKEERAAMAENPKKRRSDCRISPDEKRRLIDRVSGLSSRQAEQVLISESKKPEIHKEKLRNVGNDRKELKFSISSKAYEKMQGLRGQLAHGKGTLNLENFFEEVLNLAEQQLEGKKGLRKPATVKAKFSEESLRKTKRAMAEVKIQEKVREKFQEKASTTAVKSSFSVQTRKLKKESMVNNRKDRKTVKRVPVPTAVKRRIWETSGGACENCGSKQALEIEHIKPIAKGGGNIVENLKLLCRSCNQRAAIKEFGREKMSEFLR